MAIALEHNLTPESFKWLWAKYVRAPNTAKHCTASLRATSFRGPSGKLSPYSLVFSKASNPLLGNMPRLALNECSLGSFAAIYICGVSALGYSSKTNYAHNLHAAIIPWPGATDSFEFEKWTLRVENGVFTRIPGPEDLPEELRHLSGHFTTCRIFRWAACVLPVILSNPGVLVPRLLLHPELALSCPPTST